MSDKPSDRILWFYNEYFWHFSATKQTQTLAVVCWGMNSPSAWQFGWSVNQKYNHSENLSMVSLVSQSPWSHIVRLPVNPVIHENPIGHMTSCHHHLIYIYNCYIVSYDRLYLTICVHLHSVEPDCQSPCSFQAYDTLGTIIYPSKQHVNGSQSDRPFNGSVSRDFSRWFTKYVESCGCGGFKGELLSDSNELLETAAPRL